MTEPNIKLKSCNAADLELADQNGFWAYMIVDGEIVGPQFHDNSEALAKLVIATVKDNPKAKVMAFAFVGRPILVTKGPKRYLRIPHLSDTSPVKYVPLFEEESMPTDFDLEFVASKDEKTADANYLSTTKKLQEAYAASQESPEDDESEDDEEGGTLSAGNDMGEDEPQEDELQEE